MVLLVVIIAVMQLAVACTGLGWTANEYPNPQTDAFSCNRSEKSSVCDPEVLLSSDEGELLATDSFSRFVMEYNGTRVHVDQGIVAQMFL